MAKSKVFAVKFRRRRTGKTNYSHRLRLLKSNTSRLVVRVSNKYVTAQIVKSKNGQDYVMFSVSSKALSKKGWKYSYKNIPACYLTGLVAGKGSPVKELILDAGVSKPSSRVYAVLKGCVDAGIKVSHAESALPSGDRVAGKHINEKIVHDFEGVKEKLLKNGKKKKQ